MNFKLTVKTLFLKIKEHDPTSLTGVNELLTLKIKKEEQMERKPVALGRSNVLLFWIWTEMNQ